MVRFKMFFNALYENPIKVSLAVSHEETHHFVLQASQSGEGKNRPIKCEMS